MILTFKRDEVPMEDHSKINDWITSASQLSDEVIKRFFHKLY